MKYGLGIESTAHTFGAGIVDEKLNVLAHAKAQFTSATEGIKPSDAARHHFEHAFEVIQKTLAQSGRKMKEMEVIAFAQGPGLGPCLKVGATAARALSIQFKKPLMGVNHGLAHISSGMKSTKARDPVIVYVSGGNTQIIAFKEGRYRILGETLDIGVGNLLDSFGRSMGMGFPAGPRIDAAYFEGKNLIELPYSVKGMDLAFSGLLTAARTKIGKENEKDLCFSLMHTAFAMITEVTERALAHTGKKEVLLTGGVACSQALQEMMQKMTHARNARLHVTPAWLAQDNGAMIALQGMLEFKSGKTMSVKESGINQHFRLDEVEVKWKND
ncbi:MAG: N(6)-L-threonylcarbamoyladenine synthase Kae1 [Candidatus Diapherotrites archaeon]|nr:N(6)-L-threonylcarbamoyladenine synthase Kae1 [Candidatus Diapherotrites archaeon]